MRSNSATPAELRKEMRRALPKMAAALPEAERRRLMPDPTSKSLRAAEFTMMASDAQENRSEEIRRGEVQASGRDARASGLVAACVALADWVGGGKQVTSAGPLRPAVGREAYQHLDLWTSSSAGSSRASPAAV